MEAARSLILRRAYHLFDGSALPTIDLANVPLDWTGIATLAGPSGSGKTTLFRVLSGWFEGNRTICEFDPALDCFRRVRFIGVHGSLLPWWSVERNLEFRSFPRSRIDSALETVGLPRDVRTRSVHELSYGMYKRIELLIAIAEEPDLLLLDEFFSSIDDFAKNAIRDFVMEQRPRKLTWVIAHEVDLRRWLGPNSYSLVIDSSRRCVTGIERL